jgi:sulfide:quinone oxidoreductase
VRARVSSGGGGFTHSICSVDHAQDFFADYQEFPRQSRPIVVIGAMPGASCFGPAYEFAFILDTDLRKRKLRNKVPITYVTSEPYIGHLGLGGVGDSKSMLESEMRSRDMKWITNAKTTKVEEGKMFVTQLDDLGAGVQGARGGVQAVHDAAGFQGCGCSCGCA